MFFSTDFAEGSFAVSAIVFEIINDLWCTTVFCDFLRNGALLGDDSTRFYIAKFQRLRIFHTAFTSVWRAYFHTMCVSGAMPYIMCPCGVRICVMCLLCKYYCCAWVCTRVMCTNALLLYVYVSGSCCAQLLACEMRFSRVCS